MSQTRVALGEDHKVVRQGLTHHNQVIIYALKQGYTTLDELK